MEKRVAVTGMGAITPVGNTVTEFWHNIKNGACGIGPITRFDTEGFKAKLAAEVKGFDPEQYFPRKEAKRMDLFSQYAIAAAVMAVEDSGIKMDEVDKTRFGVIVGSGIGGLQVMEEQIGKLFLKGPNRVAPMFIPMSIGNMAAGNIAVHLGTRGICSCVVTACASGTNAIGDAFRAIKHGYADRMIAGGAEGAITKIGIAGFANLNALTLTENPTRASIPFDKERSGFVMGEGAGILVLEDLDLALARKAHIYGEVVGYGSTCDAYHMTSPHPQGEGAVFAMANAIEEAGIQPNQIGYINAHGTSTQPNDVAETRAIHTLFGSEAPSIPVSSIKSMVGHLLGAAGGVEAIAAMKALEDGYIPPTIGYEQKDPECDLDYVPNKGREKNIEYAISNSFGFGGHNAVVCLKKWSE